MIDLLHQPGFLGTHANFAADFTLIMMLLIAGLFTLGVGMARRQRYEAHRWIQTSAALLNLVMVLWMMILPFRDFVVRDVGGPRPTFFYTVTSAHAIIGFVALTFGLFVTLRGNELVPQPLKFNNYKLYMRVSYGLYMGATLLGVWVYVIWFMLIPNPPQF
ncbi:MAG: DUF420 domain-containing protein [Chloroflexota bacterium]|jgi:uncharacterized membrane protein YozB (DUF420 family)